MFEHYSQIEISVDKNEFQQGSETCINLKKVNGKFNCNKCDLCAKCSQCKLCKICDLFTTEFKPCKQCAKCSLCDDCKYCKTCSKEELAGDTKGRKGLEDLFNESQKKKFLQEVYWNVILNRK